MLESRHIENRRDERVTLRCILKKLFGEWQEMLITVVYLGCQSTSVASVAASSQWNRTALLYIIEFYLKHNDLACE
jgi:hypothetical protein